MPTYHGAAWDRHGEGSSSEVVQYGPHIESEAELRLLGTLKGKRLLDLGCGEGHGTIALARQGAHAIGVDASAERITAARRLAERQEIRVELHHSDLADLAFVRADTIDGVLSVYALTSLEDLNRLFRQVHRVLRTGAFFVFSLPHPAYDMIEDDEDPLMVRRSYFDRSPVHYEIGEVACTDYRRTVSDLITGLTRANFSVDMLLEPEPQRGNPPGPFWREAFRYVPRTLLVRARKEGI